MTTRVSCVCYLDAIIAVDATDHYMLPWYSTGILMTLWRLYLYFRNLHKLTAIQCNANNVIYYIDIHNNNTFVRKYKYYIIIVI